MTDCIESKIGSVNDRGYYYTRIGNGKSVRVHRVVYEIFYGRIPRNREVRHKCDNKRCVNPDHLEVGTHQDNMTDAVLRGLSPRGERSGMSKMTAPQARWIKRLIKQKMPHRDIANTVGVSLNQVRDISAGRSWAWA